MIHKTIQFYTVRAFWSFRFLFYLFYSLLFFFTFFFYFYISSLTKLQTLLLATCCINPLACLFIIIIYIYLYILPK